MQVSVETTSGLERRLIVGIPATEVDNAVESKLRDAAKQVRLDGFRPGKVPFREVKRRFGKSIRAEVIGDVINNKVFEAISQQDFTPAGTPTIEDIKDEPGKDIEFTAVFEVYPEVELKGLTEIEVTRPVAEINDSDVDLVIDKLREQRATYNDVERPAQQGDRVIIDFAGTIDGEAFEGGSAAGQTLDLGSGSMIPGFEDGLVGSSAGEEKTLELTFPDDYQAENLRGKTAQFAVTVKQVQEKVLPEVNEEFIAQFGPEDSTPEGFRTEVRKNMERELKNAIKNRIKQQVMDGLLNQNETDVPASLVKSEIQRQRQQMLQQFGGGANIDETMLPDNLFEEQAKRMVKLGLLLGEVIKAKEIKADPADVRLAIEEIAEPYENPEQVVAWYYEQEQQLRQVESLVLENTAVDTLLQGAQVSDQEMSYEEAVKPAQ